MKINKSTAQITEFCLENSQKWLRSIAYFITVDVRFISVSIDRTVKLFWAMCCWTNIAVVVQTRFAVNFHTSPVQSILRTV